MEAFYIDLPLSTKTVELFLIPKFYMSSHKEVSDLAIAVSSQVEVIEQ